MGVDKTSHSPFHKSFIRASIALAIFGGFSLGTHVAFPIGLKLNLPPYYHIYAHTHGHIQLLGWTGLFIMGVSLFFIPRFVKVPLPYPGLIKWILTLIVTGLILRTGGMFTVPYLEPGLLNEFFRYLVKSGAMLEWGGVLLYAFTLMALIGNKPGEKGGMKSIKPFFLMMVIGFFVYSTLHLLQVFLYDIAIRLPWNHFSVDLFIKTVLFPAAFLFSIRTFPLFLQIPPFKKSFYRYGLVYGLSITGFIIGTLTETTVQIEVFSSMVTAIIILYLVYQIKLYPKMFLSAKGFMLRYYGEGYLKNRIDSGAFKQARPGYYDYGQFGKFELSIFSAYVWLTLYAVLEIIRNLFLLLDIPLHFGHDPVRHIFLLGFITMLIFGMAHRMLPGFIRKQRSPGAKSVEGIRHKWIVSTLFYLGNLAVITRVLPMLIPASISAEITLITGSLSLFDLLMYGFGISGLLAITTLVLLWINLERSL